LIFGVFVVLFNFLLFASTPMVAGAVAREETEEVKALFLLESVAL
jgi:hypothetical protein